MHKKLAGNVVELPSQVDRKYLEHQHCETVREMFQTIQPSSLGKFTYSLIDSLWDDLSAVVHHLERLPESVFKEMIEVIDGLSEARNELRLARFLFDVAEINSVHRLVMRNRAVLRGKHVLHKVLLVWPLHSSF